MERAVAEYDQLIAQMEAEAAEAEAEAEAAGEESEEEAEARRAEAEEADMEAGTALAATLNSSAILLQARGHVSLLRT